MRSASAWVEHAVYSLRFLIATLFVEWTLLCIWVSGLASLGSSCFVASSRVIELSYTAASSSFQ